MFMDS